MSNKVYFMNNGSFDVRAMLIFGVSAKGKDDAIGYFGTGFKYAVAIILRLGGSISIRTGEQNYQFTARRENIRGKEFDLVLMNGSEAGFTTHLGANWEPWMAFRELYCNCKDEGGTTDTKLGDFETIVTVDCAAIRRAFDDRSEFFISGEPDLIGGEVEIFSRPSKYVFFRGIAVKAMAKPGMWTYNILSNVELTEDRTAKHDHQLLFPVQRTVQRIRDSAMCRKLLTAHPESFEGNFRFDSDWGASDEFIETVRQLMASGVGVSESARLLVRRLDEKAGNWPETYLSKVQLEMLNRSIQFLKRIGIDPQQFEIKTLSRHIAAFVSA